VRENPADGADQAYSSNRPQPLAALLFSAGPPASPIFPRSASLCGNWIEGVHGALEIMDIFFPRIPELLQTMEGCRYLSGKLPGRDAAFSGRILRIALAMVDFPHPDSPTSPSFSAFPPGRR